MNEPTSRGRRGVSRPAPRRGARRAGISRHQPRPGGRDPHRPPDAADRISRSARRVRGDGRQARRRGDQCGGGVMGRKIELIAEDSVNPQTASTKAQRLIERDKVAAIVGEISSASGLAIAQVAQRNRILFFNTGCNSDELRGKACNRYMFHTEAANTMYVYAAGQALLARRHGQGQEVVQPDRRLRVRPRSSEGGQALHARQRRRVRRGRARADRRRRLLGVPAQDPQREARRRGVEPRRRADHELHEAVRGIRAAVSRRRLRASTPRSRGARARAT